jgi:hypothetical protein
LATTGITVVRCDAGRLDHIGLDPHLAELDLAEFADVVDVEDKAEGAGRAGVEVVQRHPPAPLVGGGDGVGLEEAHAGHSRVNEPDLDLDVLGGEGDQALDLALEDPRHLVRGLDVPVVAAAGAGHGLEQVLVEAGAEADTGGGDPVPCPVPGEADQLLGLDDADVGLAVGQEDDPVGALDHALAHQAGALEPAAGEVGRAAGADPGDRLGGGRAAGGSGAEDGPNRVVEGDHREPVGRGEEGGEPGGGILGGLERHARHGAGAVEHQGDVNRGTADGGFAFQADQHADLVGVLGGQEAGGQTDVGLHAGSGRWFDCPKMGGGCDRGRRGGTPHTFPVVTAPFPGDPMRYPIER